MPTCLQTRAANRTQSRAPAPEVWQTRPDQRTHRPPAQKRLAGCRAAGRPDPDLDFGSPSNLFGKAAFLGIGRRSANPGTTLAKTLKQTANRRRVVWRSPGIALAMFHVRGGCCPGLKQGRAMLEEADLPSASRALVLVGPAAAETHPRRPVQRVASFVTQLIANASRVPQTREKRRAEPTEVIAAYRATVERLQKLNEKSE
jgi:hypothetical protein